MPAPPIYDYTKFNYDKPLFNIDDIRRINPQRDAMEQLTGIVYVDTENHGIVGFKDVTEHEFWSQGHMPGFPLMPGVVLCESAAQLAGFYARKYNMLGGDFLGFGGMDDVRFRHPVLPPARLILVAKFSSLRGGRRAEFTFQGYVNDRLVIGGNLIGVPIHVSELVRPSSGE